MSNQSTQSSNHNSRGGKTSNNRSNGPKMIYNWEVENDNDGQYITGILIENKEQKEWETSYISKLVLHRQYLEAFTDSGSIYAMEYKHAKSGGHTFYL